MRARNSNYFKELAEIGSNPRRNYTAGPTNPRDAYGGPGMNALGQEDLRFSTNQRAAQDAWNYFREHGDIPANFRVGGISPVGGVDLDSAAGAYFTKPGPMVAKDNAMPRSFHFEGDIPVVDRRPVADTKVAPVPQAAPPEQMITPDAEPAPNRIMGGLQSLGDLFNRMDQSYAGTINRSGMSEGLRMGTGTSIQDILAMKDSRYKNAMLASNIGARYGAPLMGAALVNETVMDPLMSAIYPEEQDNVMVRYA